MDDINTKVIDDEGGIRAATDEEVEAEDTRIRGILKGEPLAAPVSYTHLTLPTKA